MGRAAGRAGDVLGGGGTMTYSDREAICLWHELKHVYPELAPPDGRTDEEKKRQAEQDKDILFGPDEREKETCLSRE